MAASSASDFWVLWFQICRIYVMAMHMLVTNNNNNINNNDHNKVYLQERSN